MTGTYTASTTTTPIIWTTTGMTIDPHRGSTPEKPPTQLLSTRAVAVEDGWLGQIVMAGVIVFETRPRKTSEAALKLVNRRIYDRLKWLVVHSDDDDSDD